MTFGAAACGSSGCGVGVSTTSLVTTTSFVTTWGAAGAAGVAACGAQAVMIMLATISKDSTAKTFLDILLLLL
jgi:hypothetical protein